jgi:predicted nucleotidyltransferase
MRSDREEILVYLRGIKEELREVGIDRVGIFGSVARGRADILSDIDIVIHTTPEFVARFEGAKGFIYLDNLRRKLEKRFGRKVDLCDETGLRKGMEGVVYA